MPTRQPSWEAVARAMADRLYWHAQCSTHSEEQPGEDCPHCEDRNAYRLWERKSGRIRRPPEIPGETVDIRTLL